jgi:hypothetical protein
LKGVEGKVLLETPGFTEGMKPSVYRSEMLAAKLAPCPSGAVSPDSFRAWEALEAGAIPILDTESPVDGVTEYWRRLFADLPTPAPEIHDWQSLPGYIDDLSGDWPANANRVQAWWARYKRELSIWLKSDLQALGAL